MSRDIYELPSQTMHPVTFHSAPSHSEKPGYIHFSIRFDSPNMGGIE